MNTRARNIIKTMNRVCRELKCNQKEAGPDKLHCCKWHYNAFKKFLESQREEESGDEREEEEQEEERRRRRRRSGPGIKCSKCVGNPGNVKCSNSMCKQCCIAYGTLQCRTHEWTMKNSRKTHKKK